MQPRAGPQSEDFAMKWDISKGCGPRTSLLWSFYRLDCLFNVGLQSHRQQQEMFSVSPNSTLNAESSLRTAFVCVCCELACMCVWAVMASFNNRFNCCQTPDKNQRNETEKEAERDKSGEGVRDKKRQGNARERERERTRHAQRGRTREEEKTKDTQNVRR